MDMFKSRAPFKRNDTGEIAMSTVKDYGVSNEKELPAYDNETAERRGSVASYNISGIHDETHRKLKPRHIQLIGIETSCKHDVCRQSLTRLGRYRWYNWHSPICPDWPWSDEWRTRKSLHRFHFLVSEDHIFSATSSNRPPGARSCSL